jgi:hypothetical protein
VAEMDEPGDPQSVLRCGPVERSCAVDKRWLPVEDGRSVCLTEEGAALP